ncbi:MAG TPA: hypothetical protein VFE93_10920, partial [Myxococcaceae bacterium]|nr:hypothetical protein [Myxococcaceae bacterium]
QGRYQDVASSLRVKEVRIAEDERFVICHSPEGAERDAAIRARMIAQLKELIDESDALGKDKRAELRGVISTQPGLNRYLRRGGNHYIIGERLRSGSPEAAAALSRQGRYQEVAASLRVKEVRIAEDERFVICHNPEGAERDEAIRARLIAQLKELIDGTDALGKDKRAELRGVISTKPGLNRYLRVTPGGLLRIDAARAKAEENLDGKYLLRTSDPKMTAEDIALGYRQLLEVERGWRDMKQVIDLRPVYHRKEERIRAHVILCWLALLLARIAENVTGDTWPQLRRQLDRIAVGTFTGPAGTFRQRTEISPAQAAILEQLGIDPPPRIYQLTPAATG